MSARLPAASPLVDRRRHDAVSAPDAYTRSGRFAERGDVVVDRAVDPITGLPVLVYRFAGTPVSAARSIDSDDVWRVLEHGVDDRGGYLVTDVIEGAASIEARPAALDDHGAERAFAAAAAAASRGVVHGDLGAHRLYRRGADVWIEGYGVPWTDGTPQDDARSLARSLLALRGHVLTGPAVAALQRASEDGDAAAAAKSLRAAGRARKTDPAAREPAPPPDARSLPDAPAQPHPPASPGTPLGEGATPRPQRNAASAEFDRVRVGAVPDGEAATPGSGAAPGSPYVAPDFPGPAPMRAAPDAVAPSPAGRAAADPGPRFSKAPPPDVTYRSGAFAPPERDGPARVAAVVASVRDRRRVWLLGLLVVAAMALALVTVMGREASPAREAIGSGGSYVVDVRVEPASLPPVSLVIVASPPGSQHAPNTVIRTVPDKVVLDREGTWQLQGRFDGRRSQIVTIAVPRDQLVVLPFTDTP
jgi:hypothetical protein